MSQSIAFDRAAEFYDATRGFPPGIETQAAAAIIGAGSLGAGSHLLEIGIGTGRIALPLAQHVKAIEGIDLSRPMLQRLRAKHDGEPVRVVQGDVTYLPYLSGYFDAVVAVHIFHLVADYARALDEAARVLRTGGVLVHAFGASERRVSLDTVWVEVTGRRRGADAGMPWEKRKTVAEDHGWTLVGERIVDYTERRSPRQYLQQLRDRCWSHTWQMSDHELERAVEAMEARITAQYDDPDAEEVLPSRFIARAYRPPALR